MYGNPWSASAFLLKSLQQAFPLFSMSTEVASASFSKASAMCAV
jgi:hypothetical protein